MLNGKRIEQGCNEGILYTQLDLVLYIFDFRLFSSELVWGDACRKISFSKA